MHSIKKVVLGYNNKVGIIAFAGIAVEYLEVGAATMDLLQRRLQRRQLWMRQRRQFLW